MPLGHVAGTWALIAGWDRRQTFGEKTASDDELQAMLKPYPADGMEAYRIGAKFSSPK